MFDLTTVLFLMAMTWAGLTVLRVRQVAGGAIRKARVELHAAEDAPAVLVGCFEPAAQQLQALGFEFSHWQTIEGFFSSSRRWSLVYVHPVEKAVAWVEPTSHPGSGHAWDIGFYSWNPDGSGFGTVSWRLHQMIPGAPGWTYDDAQTSIIIEQWKRHLDRRREHVIEPVVWEPSVQVLASAEFLERYRRRLVESGQARHIDDDHVRLRPLPAYRFTKQYTDGEARFTAWASRQPRESRDETSVELEAFLYRQAQNESEQHRTSWLGKLLLFAGSLVVAMVALGLTFTWESGLLILLVLVFHEFGHLAAMRYFGFRDLKILFIPILGALTIGEKDRASAYQRFVVSLMGPIPGILTGLALLVVLRPEPDEVLFELALFLLVLNYFNLLPFAPLDGGHVVELLLFRRYPYIRVAFGAVSIAAFAIAAYTFGDPILAFLALIMLPIIHLQWQTATLHSRLSEMRPADRVSDEQLTSVFAEMRRPPFQTMSADRKAQLASSLIEEWKQPEVGWPLRIAGLGIQFGLLAPLIFAILSFR